MPCIYTTMYIQDASSPSRCVSATLPFARISPVIRRRTEASQPRTPAIKSSIAVQSPRLDFCEGPSSFLAVGSFLEMRGTSGDSCQVQFASHFAGVLFGSRRKGFPLRLFVRFKRPFLPEHRNLLRYNRADIESATPEVRPSPHVRQPGGRRLIDSPVIRHVRQARASAVKRGEEGYVG